MCCVRSMAGYVMHVDCGHNGPLDEACSSFHRCISFGCGSIHSSERGGIARLDLRSRSTCVSSRCTCACLNLEGRKFDGVRSSVDTRCRLSLGV